MPTTFQQFIAFVLASPPETKLDHTQSFNKCAVGLFGASVLPGKRSAAVFDMLKNDQPIMTCAEFPSYIFYSDDGTQSSCATLTQALDQTELMSDHVPTMGDLVQFIQMHFPELLDDAG